MASNNLQTVDAARVLPKGPVFGWSSFQFTDAPGIPSVEDLPHIAFTTSGRSAIYQALLQMRLPLNSIVLVPTYHCPTMVAPVLLADHQPVYFGIRADGLPDLQSIDPSALQQARAMIVSHYFGLAQSLHEVHEWCDSHGIALIEDCAHCYFGQAGERPIGAWGDYCTASLSKFYPVPEAGLLGSNRHSLHPLRLAQQGIKAQIKGWIDVIETATRHQRLWGLTRFLAAIFNLKRRAGEATTSPVPALSVSETAMMEGCNMARIRYRPLAVSMLLRRMLPRGRIIAQRQRNFSVYFRLLSDLTGAKPLVALPKKPVAPYVFPLWVDDADRIYHALRAQGIPVFRWDQIWPGTPTLLNDVGLEWSQHVLQLLCHQDLSEDDIRYSAQCLQTLLKAATFTPSHNTPKYNNQACPL